MKTTVKLTKAETKAVAKFTKTAPGRPPPPPTVFITVSGGPPGGDAEGRCLRVAEAVFYQLVRLDYPTLLLGPESDLRRYRYETARALRPPVVVVMRPPPPGKKY